MDIGTDRVHFENERLFIHAAEPMDLPGREFCKVPVYFNGGKYCVRSRREGERPYAMVYELWPWPADLHESSTRHLIYDESYVIQRNEMALKERRHERIHIALILLYPFLGLCWSRFKNDVLSRVGFRPDSITRMSVFMVFSLFFVEGIFIGWLHGGFLFYFIGHPRLEDWVMLVFWMLLGADTVIRFDQSLRGTDSYWGFCEWMRRKRET